MIIMHIMCADIIMFNIIHYWLKKIQMLDFLCYLTLRIMTVTNVINDKSLKWQEPPNKWHNLKIFCQHYLIKALNINAKFMMFTFE
jgi:hypothetical protein